MTENRTQIRAVGIWVVENHVLLHAPHGSERWRLPGGKLETGETVEQAVVREFWEELGVSVAAGRVVAVGEVFWRNRRDELIREYGFYFRLNAPPPAEFPTVTSRIPRLRFAWHALDSLPTVLPTFAPSLILQPANAPVQFFQVLDDAGGDGSY